MIITLDVAVSEDFILEAASTQVMVRLDENISPNDWPWEAIGGQAIRDTIKKWQKQKQKQEATSE